MQAPRGLLSSDSHLLRAVIQFLHQKGDRKEPSPSPPLSFHSNAQPAAQSSPLNPKEPSEQGS
jgi:hypothetical protein